MGVVKVLLYSATYLFLFLGVLLKSEMTFAAQVTVVPALKTGIDLLNFNACQQGIQRHCATFSESCILATATSYPICQQLLLLIQTTGGWPALVQTYQNVAVVKAYDFADTSNVNFYMVTAEGEIVLPTAQISMQEAPGFLTLKQAYPEAVLTNKVLDYPEAVFLTGNIQELMLDQNIVDPKQNNKSVGFAKVLYRFTLEGGYQGVAVMRVMANPWPTVGG